MGIHTGNNPLCSGFLVARSSVHLTGQEEVLHHLGTKGIVQILRIEIVVFHRISRLKEHGVLQSLDGMDSLQLHFQRQRRRKALEVILRRVYPLRLQEQLVGILIGESTKLILNAGTIARTLAVNHPGKEG